MQINYEIKECVKYELQHMMYSCFKTGVANTDKVLSAMV